MGAGHRPAAASGSMSNSYPVHPKVLRAFFHHRRFVVKRRTVSEFRRHEIAHEGRRAGGDPAALKRSDRLPLHTEWRH